jgi:hypothetical protein
LVFDRRELAPGRAAERQNKSGRETPQNLIHGKLATAVAFDQTTSIASDLPLTRSRRCVSPIDGLPNVGVRGADDPNGLHSTGRQCHPNGGSRLPTRSPLPALRRDVLPPHAAAELALQLPAR